jgi:tRNA pseudouridine55 synthase
MYSAKKIGGVKLYELARRGQEIERAPVEVEIKKLELCEPARPGAENTFSFRVICSSGTYIRSLLEKMFELSRSGEIETSIISISDAITLEDLPLSGEEKKDILLGRPVNRRGEWLNGCLAKLSDSDRNLIAMAEFDAERQVWRRL